MAAAAAAVVVAAGPAGSSWGDDGESHQRGLGSAVTVVVLDAAAERGDSDDDSGEAAGEASGDNRTADSSSSLGSGGPGDSGTHGLRLLNVPVTPQERAARSVGLDGVVLRGWHLRALRRYAGLSIPELAARLSYSRSQIWSWECERHACPQVVYPALIAVIETARTEREALMRRARLHLIVIDEEDEGGEA